MSTTITEPMAAVAQLVGEARLGLLHARTPGSLDSIQSVREVDDWRDIPDHRGFAWLCSSIRQGYTRRDAEWSRGADADLVRLVEIAEGVER